MCIFVYHIPLNHLGSPNIIYIYIIYINNCYKNILDSKLKTALKIYFLKSRIFEL